MKKVNSLKCLLTFIFALLLFAAEAQNIRHDQLKEPQAETSDSLIFYMHDAEGYWRLGKGVLDTTKVFGLDDFARKTWVTDKNYLINSDLSGLRDSTLANTGKDTTGIYHVNRELLDAITENDTTRWGEQPEFLTDLDSTNFDIDTTQVRNLKTFVANNSGSALISGTSGYLPKFGASGLTESIIQEIGSNISINYPTNVNYKFGLIGNSLAYKNETLPSSGVIITQSDMSNVTITAGSGAVVARNSRAITTGTLSSLTGGHVVGQKGEGVHFGTGTIGHAFGVEGAVQNLSTGTITEAAAVVAHFQGNVIGGTIDNYYAFMPTVYQGNLGQINRWVDYYSPDIGTGGTGIISDKYSFLNVDENKKIQSYGSAYFATSSGNVGIGTTTPTEKLEVNGNIKADNGKFDEVYLGANNIRDTLHIDRANWIEFVGNWSGAGGAGGATNLSTTYASESVTITSDTGTDAVINRATNTTAGIMAAGDKARLETISVFGDGTKVLTNDGTYKTRVSSVTGGTGITQTGTTGAVTLNLNAATSSTIGGVKFGTYVNIGGYNYNSSGDFWMDDSKLYTATPVSSDIIGFYDVSSGFNKKCTIADLLSLGGSGGSMVYPGAGIPVSTGSAWGTSITNNSSNWNTAYTDRNKWDGGSTGLNATTGRSSLGLGSMSTKGFWTGSQASYDAISTKDSNTIYFIEQ